MGDHRRAQRAADAGRGAARADRPRPPPRDRAAVPLRRAHRRDALPARRARASCCRCSCRWPSRSSAATRSPARCRPTPCATCSCVRSPGCGCWSRSWSASSRSWCVATLAVAAVAYVEGRLFLGDAPATGVVSVSGTTLTQGEMLERTLLAFALRRARDARGRGHRAAAEHDDRLGRGGRARHDRVPDRLDGAARARRRRLAAALPAHALLARLRRPVPRPDPVDRPGPRRARAARPTWSSSPARPGPTSPPRTSTSDRRRAPSARPRRGRCPPWPARPGRPAARRAWSSTPAQTSCTSMFSAPSSSADSVGVTVWSVVGADGDPARAGRGLVAGVEPAQQVAAGGQLLARRRAATGHLARRARPRRCRGAASPASAPVVRRTSPPSSLHEEPRDHPAGRVADHVDRLGPGPVDRALGQVGEPARLHPQVTRAALGRLEDDHRATLAAQLRRRAGSRSLARAAVPGDHDHRARPRLVGGAVTDRALRPTSDRAHRRRAASTSDPRRRRGPGAVAREASRSSQAQ